MFDGLQVDPQWVVSPDNLHAIAAEYGIRIDLRSIVPLGGAVNGVVRVASDAGEIVVRVHRTWTTPDRLSFVHSVQAHLRDRGLPIPRVLTTGAGYSWTAVLGPLAEVSDYIPGGSQLDRWEQAGPVFSALGRLHAALAELRATSHPPPAHACYADATTTLAMLSETDDAFRTHVDHEDYGAALANRKVAKLLLLRLEEARAVYGTALPSTLIHGDFVGNNVLLHGNDVIAIVDFDRLAHRERIVELAYVLDAVLNNVTRSAADGWVSDDDLGGVARLLRRYEVEYGVRLGDRELAALPFEIARAPLYPIAIAGYAVFAHEGQGTIGETMDYAQYLPRALWLAENAQRISRVFTRG